MEFDLVLKNGHIVTASEVLSPTLQIGVKNGKISCIGTSLPVSANTKVIDVEGGWITPGGIDSHVHLAQTPTGDGWETGSRSAVAGGTTTLLAFAPQERSDDSLWPVLDSYHSKSKAQSYANYSFHEILTKPTPSILANELPVLASEHGITSVKLYMTYDPLKLGDADILSILLTCRANGMTTMIHAENHDMISALIQGLESRKHTLPYHHAIARPRIAEDEASYRAISLAELVDAPILIVHMSSDVAVSHVRDAQTRLLPIHAETCPQYLFLLSTALKVHEHHHDQFEGAKHICSPPLRHRKEDLDAMWRGVANGTFTVVSSDHAPTQYDNPEGKKLGLIDGIPRFSEVPNGLPGVETRMALLFSRTEACLSPSEARLTLPRFVQLTAGNAARLYGLEGRKGSIAPGYDADLCVWYPRGKGKTVISQERMHHSIDYTPFEGVEVGNWPRYTIVRGKVVWDRDGGGVVGEMGYGEFLKRGRGKVVVGRTGNVPRGMGQEERDLWMDYKPYEA